MLNIYQIFHIYQIKKLYTKHFKFGIYIYQLATLASMLQVKTNTYGIVTSS